MTSNFDHFDQDAKSAMETAHRTAVEYHQVSIDTIDILRGVCLQTTSAGAIVLRRITGTYSLSEAIEKRLYPRNHENVNPVPSHNSIAATENAVKVSRRMKDNHIGTEHLVLGIITAEGTGSSILINFGVTLERFTEELRKFRNEKEQSSRALHDAREAGAEIGIIIGGV